MAEMGNAPLGSDDAFVRVSGPIDHAEHASRRGSYDRRDRHTVRRLIDNLTEPK